MSELNPQQKILKLEVELNESKELVAAAPRALKVIESRIDDCKALIISGIDASVNRKTLKKLEKDRDDLSGEIDTLNKRIAIIPSEIKHIKDTESQAFRRNEAAKYFKALKRFAEYHAERLEKNNGKPRFYNDGDDMNILVSMANAQVVKNCFQLNLHMGHPRKDQSKTGMALKRYEGEVDDQ